MTTLYLDQQGARLGRKGRRLVLHDRSGEDLFFPVEQITQVMVYGQVQITTAALDTLLEQGITTTLLTRRGWMHGHLVGNCGGQVQRRRRQYELLSDQERALPLAQALIGAKLRNQRWLLRVLDAGRRAVLLDPLITAVRGVSSTERLRGFEGYAARIYFANFAVLLHGSAFEFPGRRRRPATDPVNALLSLGYTLLLAELQSAMAGYGLDPFAGVFHASDGGQPSCALDIMEPLRCLVDRLVIRMARHTFSPEDFCADNDGACLLADGRRGEFYRAWDELMNERVLLAGKHHSYRAIIHGQIGELARALDDPDYHYRPLVLSALGR